MEYVMTWRTHVASVSSCASSVACVLERHGGSEMEGGREDRVRRFDFPLEQRPGGIIQPPFLVMRLWNTDERAQEVGDHLVIDLSWRIELSPDRDLSRRNLRRVVEVGDAIYNAIRPFFGCCCYETEIPRGLPDFLDSGLPVRDHIVYIGPSLVHRVRMDDLGRHRHVLVRLTDGGLRVENPYPMVPTLDLK